MTDAELKEYILKHFTYCDGELIRDDRSNPSGSLDRDGYLIIKVKGKQYKAHRIVWLLHHGDFPNGEIDHINRIRTDNRIENLREADRALQFENMEHKPNPNTGAIGVHITAMDGLKKKYTTRIKGKVYRFYTIAEAVEFRKRCGLWV